MEPTMKLTALLSACVLLAGCATKWDPHAPKTVTAASEGGSVTVKHGQRLYFPLAADPNGGYEWRRVEPRIVAVMADGPPQPEGMQFTPVRSGTQKLQFDYRPVSGDGAPQRSVSYDIKVR